MDVYNAGQNWINQKSNNVDSESYKNLYKRRPILESVQKYKSSLFIFFGGFFNFFIKMIPCWYSYKILTICLFQITIWAFCPYNDRCFMQLNCIHTTNLVFQKSFTKLLHIQLSNNWHSGEEQIINNPEIVRFYVSSFFAIFIFVYFA